MIGAILKKSSRNPFLSSMQMDDQKGKWKVNKKFTKETEPDFGTYEFDYGFVGRCLDKVKDWVIDSGDRLGADVRVAAKDITKEEERPLHLSAYAVQDIHDPKIPSNELFFFSTR